MILTTKGGTDYIAPQDEKERELTEKVGMLVTELFFVIGRANRHHTIPQVEEAALHYLHSLIERVK